MLSQQKLSISSRLYIKLRPLIVPFELIENHIPKKCTVVDVGCGFGIFANFIALKSKHRIVIGMELIEKRISIAKKIYQNTPNLNFICGDITSTQIPKTDIITLVDVLHHIPILEQQENLLKSCFSVLSDNGIIIIKDVDTKPKWKYYWNYLHDYIMTKGESVLYQNQNNVKILLAKAGFKVEKVLEIKNYPYAHILYIGKKI